MLTDPVVDISLFRRTLSMLLLLVLCLLVAALLLFCTQTFLVMLQEGNIIAPQWLPLLALLVLSAVALVVVGCVQRTAAGKLQLRQALKQVMQQEKAVAEQKQALELVLEGAQLGTWSWDVATGGVVFNDRFFGMLGYEPGELPAHVDTWKRLLHPDDIAWVLAELESHLQGTALFYTTEHRLRHKAGHWVWVLDTGRVLRRDEQGRPQAAFGIHLDISERRESTRLLSLAKDESDAIIRNFLDSLIVVNSDMHVVRVNQATCQLLGYQEHELIGRSVVTLFHDPEPQLLNTFAFYRLPEPQPAVPAGLLPNITWAVLQHSDELRNVELCYRHKDGSRLPMSFNIQLLRNEQGEVSGCIAGGKDVSSLRQAIDTIGQQKRYIETLFDIIPVGLVALSPNNEVMRSNQAFRTMMERCSARLVISMEECSQRLISQIVGEPAPGALCTISLDREEVSAHFRCGATSISSLQGIAAVLTVDDITSEVVAEEAKRFLAAVIEQTGDAVLVTGTDGVIRYVNPATIQSTGYSAEELVGRVSSIFTDELVDARVLEDLRRTLQEGSVWSGHLRSRHKDGAIIEEDVTVSPIRNEAGQTTHYVAIWRDITELVRLQRQLVQAQKLESIGQLAAGIAHEINTPMQYVQNNVTFFDQSFDELQGLLGVIEQTPAEQLPAEIVQEMAGVDLGFLLDEVPASIRETLQGINRVVKIVAAMKEFSHPGSNEKMLTDLNHSIESTLIVCRNEWKYVAETVTDLAEDLPLVPCFSDQLHQAMVNLVINAAHAIQARKAVDPEISGRITVSTQVEGDWVEIRIGDNGSGIPEVIRSRIFEPFFTTKEMGKGTGQGLAIVYEVVVNKHGGKIDFTAVIGQGTTFILRLPIDQNNQGALV